MLGGLRVVPIMIVVGLVVLAAVFLPLPPPILIGLIVIGLLVTGLLALLS